MMNKRMIDETKKLFKGTLIENYGFWKLIED
jgi:hypothetical protein